MGVDQAPGSQAWAEAPAGQATGKQSPRPDAWLQPPAAPPPPVCGEEVESRLPAPSLLLQVSPEVLRQPERFSLIYSQHPFIVPGGRFREFYYW